MTSYKKKSQIVFCVGVDVAVGAGSPSTKNLGSEWQPDRPRPLLLHRRSGVATTAAMMRSSLSQVRKFVTKGLLSSPLLVPIYEINSPPFEPHFMLQLVLDAEVRGIDGGTTNAISARSLQFKHASQACPVELRLNQIAERKRCCQVAKPTTFGTSTDHSRGK